MTCTRFHHRARGIALLVVGLAAAPTGAQVQSHVAVIQIGPFDGGDTSQAYAINNPGVVAATQWFGLNKVAFIWDHGQYTYLGSINGGNTEPSSINDAGEVVGVSNVSGFEGHAFCWSNGRMTDLGTLGGDESAAYAIGEDGTVVGVADIDAQSQAGFQWTNGQMVRLATFLGGEDCAALACTSNGAVVAGSGDTPDGYFHAALWSSPENVTDLGLFAGDRVSSARGINDAGDVVGYSGNGGSENHAFLWRDNTLIDIHHPGVSRYSVAHDINNCGEIVGVGHTGSSSRAIYWTPQLNMIDLNDIIPPNSGWLLEVAWNMNDAGQIACKAKRNGEFVGALVTPVSPTLDLAPPSPGVAGTSNTLTVANLTSGARVAFLYSKRGGGTIIPGCNLQQNALQLDNPTIIGSAIANENGIATITRTVPLIARNQTILFQAVVQNECVISQLVVHEFE